MVIGLVAVADHFYFFVHQPLRAFVINATTIGKIVVAIGPFVMKAGVNHDDIALLYFGAGIFKIRRRDNAPFAFGNGYSNTGSAKTP